MPAEHIQQTSSVVARFYDCALRSDVEAIGEILHPDVVIHEAASLPFGGAHTGRVAVLELLGTLFAGIDLDSVVRGDVLVHGERAAAFLEIPFRTADPANTEAMPIIETFVVRDGLITEIRPYYFDTAAIAAQLTGAKP
jgi:uncharacterized protein